MPLVMKTPLTPDSKFMLLGWQDLLYKAPPNGRLIHSKMQTLTAIKICLDAQMEPPDIVREEARRLIRELYRKSS